MSAISSFRCIENKYDVYKGKNCMKKFCEFLKEYAVIITNLERKKWICWKRPAGKEKSVKKKLKINIWKFENKYLKDKKYSKNEKYWKVWDNSHYTGEYIGAGHSICNLTYNIANKIPIVFQNGSNYDYHFIIEELAEEFKKQFTCLRENTEKYIRFTVSIEKEVTRINKNGEEITKNNLTFYSFLIVQDLWQAHYQILLIILLKEN